MPHRGVSLWWVFCVQPRYRDGVSWRGLLSQAPCGDKGKRLSDGCIDGLPEGVPVNALVLGCGEGIGDGVSILQSENGPSQGQRWFPRHQT